MVIFQFAWLYKSDEGLRSDIEQEIDIKFYPLYLWDRSIVDEYTIRNVEFSSSIDRNYNQYSGIRLIWIQRGTGKMSVVSGCPH